MALTLVCPFNIFEGVEHHECGFTTESEAEYMEHTKMHKPSVLPAEDKLWEKRLYMAKKYADKSEPKRPWMFAANAWKDKPKNQDCGSWGAMLQDFGVTDNDCYAGLDAAVGGRTR